MCDNKRRPQSSELASCQPQGWGWKTGKDAHVRSGNSQQWEPSIPVPIDWISHGGSPAGRWNERGGGERRGRGRRRRRDSSSKAVKRHQGEGGVKGRVKSRFDQDSQHPWSRFSPPPHLWKKKTWKQIRGDLKRRSMKANGGRLLKGWQSKQWKRSSVRSVPSRWSVCQGRNSGELWLVKQWQTLPPI